ncbi:hypothetical protein O181_110304 [Austropuccinia psidii MF-1]|uniref:Uncharacterized protein n=1 Tax=Austropuccinia psidii MF-1 TaxID=1389203 RepID=A0A9Q3PQP4_9BASI|nr:hypothetical protein [Austropuccinia psidii MF-1]
MFSEDKKKRPSQGKDNSPVEAPQAYTSKNYASTSAKQGQANPKEKSERQEKGKAKGKGKCKTKVEQALPTELQNSQEGEESQKQCVQYGKNSHGIQKQGGGNIERIIYKEVDSVKLVTHFET